MCFYIDSLIYNLPSLARETRPLPGSAEKLLFGTPFICKRSHACIQEHVACYLMYVIYCKSILKILFLAMANNTHTARWVGQLAGTEWDLHACYINECVSCSSIRVVTAHTFWRLGTESRDLNRDYCE